MVTIRFELHPIATAPTLASFMKQQQKEELQLKKENDDTEKIKSDFSGEIKNTVYKEIREKFLKHVELGSSREFVDEILEEYHQSSKSKNLSIEKIFEKNFQDHLNKNLQTEIKEAFLKKAMNIFERMFIGNDEQNVENYLIELGDEVLSNHLYLVDKIVDEIKDSLLKSVIKKLK
ncbi:MAG: hypothetical protein LBE20_06615 [Deltaproteobacteria bacterium]|nr:hypothetical protein [Deltaproteobacteria bacterium]